MVLLENVCAVILAAGDGKRMKSEKPKVLCEVLFRPMVLWVADALAEAGVSNCLAVLGHGREQVGNVLPAHYQTAVQTERKGTGHAVMMAADYLKSGGFRDVAILYGDAPFVTAADLGAAYNQHKAGGCAVTVFSAKVADPTGYGRIVRARGEISAIVEQADADPATLAVDEINAGVYWFDAQFLLSALAVIRPSNAQGEYYLTDMVAIALGRGLKVSAYLAHPDTALGANDRRGLSMLNEVARKSVISRLFEDGVDIPFETQVVIGPKVQIGQGSVVLPGSILKGDSVIGKNCEIGPNTQLDNALIGDDCKVIASFVESSRIMDGALIGPMANIRPGCEIGESAKVGDFVELKNSRIGQKTSVAHLSYVGDSDVGRNCNLGCGIVTVNYDGENKARTTIGDGVFVGCNTNLIAPVKLGDNSYCAAGTTVTKDVPAHALVIGRSRQTLKEGWNSGGVKFKKGIPG